MDLIGEGTTAGAQLDGGVQLHCHGSGTGERVMVLLRGWPQTALQWRHDVPFLLNGETLFSHSELDRLPATQLSSRVGSA